MDFPQWISLLLLVLFIFPLKSVSSEDLSDDNKDDDPNDDSNTDTSSFITLSKTTPPAVNPTNRGIVVPITTTDQAIPDGTTEMDPGGPDEETETYDDLYDEGDGNEGGSNDDSNTEPPGNGNVDGSDNNNNNFKTNTTTSVIALSITDSSSAKPTNGVAVVSSTTLSTELDGMNMAQSGQNGGNGGHNESDVAVKVGVPIALVGLVILIGIFRLVYSGQLKNWMMKLGIFDKTPEKSASIYNMPSWGNGPSETFVNQTYTEQSGLENTQPGSKPADGYVYDNKGQGIYDNQPQTGTNATNGLQYEQIHLEMQSNDYYATYQTIDDFTRSDEQPSAMPQGKLDGTAHYNIV